MSPRALLALAALFLVVAPAAAQLPFGVQPGLLDPDKAFRLSARALDRRTVEIEFRIAEGYYMYRERFRVATEAGRPIEGVAIPRGVPHEDRFFGKTETFRELVRIRVPLPAQEAAKEAIVLRVTSQGCADAGVCYLPQEQLVRVPLPAPKGR